MIKFKVQYLDGDQWIDARTAYDFEEAERKEEELKKETGVKTRIEKVEKDDTN